MSRALHVRSVQGSVRSNGAGDAHACCQHGALAWAEARELEDGCGSDS